MRAVEIIDKIFNICIYTPEKYYVLKKIEIETKTNKKNNIMLVIFIIHITDIMLHHTIHLTTRRT